MKFLCYFFLLLSAHLHARIAIVSDIDDTIKNIHLLSGNVIFNAFQTDKVFHGMPELYQSLESQYKNSDQKLRFFYLSNAPKKIFNKKTQKFLKKNGFPDGEVILREKMNSKNHKIDAINLIIEKYAPETIIFIGDNGEKDSEIYHEASLTLFPNSSVKKSLHFIRLAYHTEKKGKKIFEEQVFFASAIEIASMLYSKNFLDVQAVNKIIDASLDRNGSLLLPRWINCQELDLSMFEFDSELLNIGKKAIEERCLKK